MRAGRRTAVRRLCVDIAPTRFREPPERVERSSRATERWRVPCPAAVGAQAADRAGG
jgi:hypothetical protein